MNTESQHLETLSEIRSIMERSTRFISLNGLAGVFAGIFALIGATAAFFHIGNVGRQYPSSSTYDTPEVFSYTSYYIFFFVDAILVLSASIAVAVFLSVRKARRKGLKIWDHSAKRVLFNLLVPLSAGGFFSLILFYHGQFGLIAPAMLIFYGLALFTTSKYTFSDIRTLGLIELFLGILSAFFIGYGLLFWAIGFGLMHIIYGILLFVKYDR
jgi:hypothetical protein